MKKIKLIVLATISLAFIGCGGWTSEEKAVLMLHCPESIEVCECTASVIMEEFTFVEYVMLLTSFLKTSHLEEELISRGQSIENRIEAKCKYYDVPSKGDDSSKGEGSSNATSPN